MTQALCDARKGLFTDRPPHGCKNPPSEEWRISKGWVNYFTLKNAYPIEELAEINEFLSGRFPVNFKRTHLDPKEKQFLKDRAEHIRMNLPAASNQSIEEHLGRQDVNIALIRHATYDRKMESVKRAKRQQASELANLSDKALLAWKKAYIDWEKKPPPKDDPRTPSDFAALYPEEKQDKSDSTMQELEKKHKTKEESSVLSKKPKTVHVTTKSLDELEKEWAKDPIIEFKDT